MKDVLGTNHANLLTNKRLLSIINSKRRDIHCRQWAQETAVQSSNSMRTSLTAKESLLKIRMLTIVLAMKRVKRTEKRKRTTTVITKMEI